MNSPGGPSPLESGAPDPAIDCADDPIAGLRKLFIDHSMRKRIEAGQKPVQRAVFRKVHGVAGGTFTVVPDLPGHLRVGVFAGTDYPAWVRFSSDCDPATHDLKTTSGVGVKLFGVDGPKIGPAPTARTHDFLLQNHDVFFVDTARDMCEFTHAGLLGSGYDAYLKDHPVTAGVIKDMGKVVPSVLGTDYWSGLPYAFGPDAHVKYKLVPREREPGPLRNDPDYLRDDLRRRLLRSGATFDFFVQFQADPQSMPVDAATVRWSESASPPVHVATLTLPSQDVEADGQAEYGENLAFDTWHALAEHAPAGSIARARQEVYRASADLRRGENRVPVEEPAEPRAVVERGEPDTTVVRAAIHPSIGIARVGNSVDGFLLGPETDRPKPTEEAKDPTGALKRQAARFRVYGYNAAGEAVRELTAGNSEVVWTVHVANKKAAWYQFQIALDIPEANRYPDPSKLRNSGPADKEIDRDALVIDPGSRTISGRETSGAAYRFDSANFVGIDVDLGELRTDEEGRLLFLGGHGLAGSWDRQPPKTFANNDRWWDDTSDGPVTATATVDGRTVPVDPAWVVAAPPNYAPDVIGVRTLYDLLVDVNVQAGTQHFPDRVSFTRDVLPILERMVGMGWVNRGFADRYGRGAREHFLDRAYLTRLASGRPEDRELCNLVFSAFRDFDRDGPSPVPSPSIYGDAINLPPTGSPRQHSVLSATQMHVLAQWADGRFRSDLAPSAPEPFALEDLPVDQQPAMLDRASLTFCLADAFHPGCEVTWPMRHPTLYTAPFRVRHRPAGQPEPPLGSPLTPSTVTQIDGPLYGQSPGTLTRWMAIPWHTDTASCRSGYYLGYGPRYDPYLPTFWAARVPNQVLTEKDYRIVMDTSRPRRERAAAFERRAVWLRGLRGADYLEQVDSMVRDFGKLGVVTTRPGPDDGEFGAQVLVETGIGFDPEINPQRNLRMMHVPEARGLEAADAAVVITEAIEASGLDPDEVVASYVELLDGFRGRRLQ